MDLEFIVLSFHKHKLSLADHQLVVVPWQQDRLFVPDDNDNVMAMVVAIEMAVATMMAMLTLIT